MLASFGGAFEVKDLFDFKKIATVLLIAAATATAGAYIDVQIMKTKFESMIEDLKLMRSDIKEIKTHLIKNRSN